jgi:hypothetical protein
MFPEDNNYHPEVNVTLSTCCNGLCEGSFILRNIMSLGVNYNNAYIGNNLSIDYTCKLPNIQKPKKPHNNNNIFTR